MRTLVPNGRELCAAVSAASSIFSPLAVGESRLYQEAGPVCWSVLPALLVRTSLGACLGRGGASDLADRICFGAATGSAGAANVSIVDPRFGAGCGSGGASAVITIFDRGSAANVPSGGGAASRGWTQPGAVAV